MLRSNFTFLSKSNNYTRRLPPLHGAFFNYWVFLSIARNMLQVCFIMKQKEKFLTVLKARKYKFQYKKTPPPFHAWLHSGIEIFETKGRMGYKGAA